MECFAKVLLQEPQSGWLCFENPLERIEARSLGAVLPALRRIEEAAASGFFAAGFITYEASPAFDSALHTHEGGAGLLPLLWFGIFDAPRHVHVPLSCGGCKLGPWVANPGRRAYLDALAEIRGRIAAGETYQVNYTIRLRSAFSGDPFALFSRMVGAQRPSHAAYVDTGHWSICSASPELFMSLDGEHLVSRPMKGTAARPPDCEHDDGAARALAASEKNRAENVMIVDMIRNDMGRVAVPGTVQVSSRFDVERYPTVLQMTSTVEARTHASVEDILKAMFPCASVTGAPKVSTMHIIQALEAEPRGIYTGSIGCIAPNRRAWFNVAIRTVAINKGEGSAEFGTGGGIVWDSVGVDEFEECLTKSAVLTVDVPDFKLLETMRWTPVGGVWLLDRHLVRLARSAQYFDFVFDSESVLREIEDASSRLCKPSIVRLVLSRDGTVTVGVASMSKGQAPLRIALSPEPVSTGDPFLYHKTTNRLVYEKARSACPDVDDVVLMNERGELTETTIGNLVCEMGGAKLTPPLTSGLLGGTMRAELLARGEIEEHVLTAKDLARARRIYTINSVRGWVRCQLMAF
jgi:para-aminobenzoate synthetase/4-amino-4-deoxychorismate lyase